VFLPAAVSLFPRYISLGHQNLPVSLQANGFWGQQIRLLEKRACCFKHNGGPRLALHGRAKPLDRTDRIEFACFCAAALAADFGRYELAAALLANPALWLLVHNAGNQTIVTDHRRHMKTAMPKRPQRMRRIILTAIGYLGLCICAQASNLTQEEESELRSLQEESNNATSNYLDDASRFFTRDNRLFLCFDSLGKMTDRIFLGLSEFRSLTILSGVMLDKTDEARVDEVILVAINHNIKMLEITPKWIEVSHKICDSSNLLLHKSEDTVHLAKRAANFLASVKHHFEP
jgi:hypothetical protein